MIEPTGLEGFVDRHERLFLLTRADELLALKVEQSCEDALAFLLHRMGDVGSGYDASQG